MFAMQPIGRCELSPWLIPRDGSAKSIGEFENKGEREFSPPNPGEMLNWVLVLDALLQAPHGFGMMNRTSPRSIQPLRKSTRNQPSPFFL